MVVIKVSFGGDLRRVSLEEKLCFHEVDKMLKGLFQLPVSNCGLVVLHVREDGQKEAIASEKQYQALLAKLNESFPKILRLEIQGSSRFIELSHCK